MFNNNKNIHKTIEPSVRLKYPSMLSYNVLGININGGEVTVIVKVKSDAKKSRAGIILQMCALVFECAS